MAEISGSVAPGFEAVGAAFELVVADSALGGAALCILIDGAPVVDLQGGYAIPSANRRWTASTPSVLMSMTKGLIAIIVARLVDEGSLDLDAPVGRYWPEFGQAGKESITVRQVMAHRAGLSYPVDDISRDDIVAWDPVVHILERQTPLWEPGSAHQYHAMTYGWLVGEVVRRITGLDIGTAFARLLAEPSAADAWLGLPAPRLPEVARVMPEPGFVLELPDVVPNADRIVRALTLGGGMPSHVGGEGTGLNDPLLQQALVPGGLGIGTARALATLWSAAILPSAGTRPVSSAVLDDMTRIQSAGPPLWPLPGAGDESWGTGFQVPSIPMPFLGPTSFGHAGAGGQLSFADREHRLGFGFLTNDLKVANDTRVPALIAALHDSLGR